MSLGPQHPLEIPEGLVQQYKDALAKVSDLRLTVLLVFNAFEEVMRAFAAWRLGCAPESLPGSLKNSPSLLFDVVLTTDTAAKNLRAQVKQLSELRNEVAHKFHQREYKPKVESFVTALLEKPCPNVSERSKAATTERLKTGHGR